MTAVHQLLPAYADGDAISAAARISRAMLQRLGFESEIFATHFDPVRHRGIRPESELWRLEASTAAIIYHLSIGSDAARRVAVAGTRRVVVYHNITPPEFFAGAHPTVEYRLRQGRLDLARLLPVADLVIADSPFNATDTGRGAAAKTVVIPPPADIARLRPEPAVAASPTLLFVGRMAPNKRHDELLRILAAVRAVHIPGARLVLAGAADDGAAYIAALRDLARRLDVDHAVTITPRRISDGELHEIYRSASVFVCASDHEGFCIPLLEAMAFSLPVVAYRAGAVPQTLGDAGILLETRDPLVWAATVARTVEDGRLRTTLIDRGAARLRDFDHAVIAERLRDALSGIGVTP